MTADPKFDIHQHFGAVPGSVGGGGSVQGVRAPAHRSTTTVNTFAPSARPPRVR